MIPPVKIDDLMVMWESDAKVDPLDAGTYLANIPKLHAKYLRILTHHNLMVKKFNKEYNELKKVKWEYYNGDLNNPDDLEKYKLEPQLKKILRQDIQLYIDADKDLNTIIARKAINQEIVDACTYILKELHSRTFQIKSIIEWTKFTEGA